MKTPRDHLLMTMAIMLLREHPASAFVGELQTAIDNFENAVMPVDQPSPFSQAGKPIETEDWSVPSAE